MIFGNAAEHLRLEHVDPRVDRVGEDLSPRRLLQEAFDPAGLVGDHDAELERILDALESKRRHRPALLVEFDEAAQVDVRDGIPGDNEKRVVDEVLTELHAAGSPRRNLFHGVVELNPQVSPTGEVSADDLRHVGKRGDDPGDAVVAQQLEDVLHARPSHDRDHRLRLIGGERAEPRALSAGHHDRLHARIALAQEAVSSRSRRSSIGAFAAGIAPSLFALESRSGPYRRLSGRITRLPQPLTLR